MKKVLVILGPTATGKTDLALDLAKKYNGELISCDSRQVYKNLDIGTGKDLPINSKFKCQNSKFKLKSQKFKIGYHLFNGIPVWMLDVVNPMIQYTVADYTSHADIVIADILKRGKLPIIVGGTGFYLKALLEGLPNLAIPVDEKLRGRLQRLSLLELQEKLKALSPVKWKSLNESDKQNPRRLCRAIELISMYGYVKKTQMSKLKCQKWDVLKVGLTAPREILNKRIDGRVISRIDQGMVEETVNLHKNGLTYQRMRELGLEYGMLAELLENKINKEQFIELLKISIRRYAKRQMTWFKNPSTGSGCINWFDITEKKWQEKMEKIILKWYD